MHLLTLIFGIVLLPKAYTLKCYECLPGLSGSCTNTVKECPSQSYRCSALRVISYLDNSQIADISGKTCALPEECVGGSINYGIARTAFTTKCCITELCNIQPAPDPTKSNPNGRKCFSCSGETCTIILNCEGDEYYCISTTVTTGDHKGVVKGCASKLVCSNPTGAKLKGVVEGKTSCCESDYCNSSSSTRAGLLLLLAPLVCLVVLF